MRDFDHAPENQHGDISGLDGMWPIIMERFSLEAGLEQG